MDVGDVAGLLRGYKTGLLTFPELAATLLDWSDTRSLDQLTAELPEPLRRKIVDLLRDLYDNDLPAEEFVHLHKDGHIEDEKLAEIRAWLSRHR